MPVLKYAYENKEVEHMQMPNIQQIFAIKNAKDRFEANHPKLATFKEQVAAKDFVPGTEIAVAIRYPDGTEAKTGIRVKQEDMELLEAVKGLIR